ncbi:MAG: hypothetical protein AB7O04_06085 [Hyphomonadaceae bacterium]
MLARSAIRDRLDHFLALALQLCQLCLIASNRRVLLDAKRVHVPRIFLAEYLHEALVHQAFLKRLNNCAFQHIALYGELVRAGNFGIALRAGIAFVTKLYERASARATAY